MKKFIPLVCACALVCLTSVTAIAQNYYKDSVQASVLDTSALPQSVINGVIVSNNVTANQVYTSYNVHAAIQRYPSASAAYLRQVYLYTCSCDETLLKAEMESHPEIWAGAQLIMIPEVLGVNNLTAKSDLQLYPNPAADILHIKSAAPLQNLRITDVSGKTVLYQPNPAETVDIHALPAGNYLLSAVCNGGMITKMIARQ